MRTFVTGATGFVGRALVQRLRGAGHQVTALLLPREDAAGFLANGVDVVRGDITRPSTLHGKLAGCDSVVHLAGAVGDGPTWECCRRLNVSGSRIMAHMAVREDVHHFVHMSSVAVYGRQSGIAVHEDSPLKKIGDPYGDTKIEAEAAVEEVFAARGILTILRPTVIYGPGDDKFLPRVLAKLRSGQARIIGDGQNTVDLVHVSDVTAFIQKLLEDPATAGGRFNLCHEDNPCWESFLHMVAEVAGLPAPKGTLPYSVAYLIASLAEALSVVTGRAPLLSRYAVRVIGNPYHYQGARARAAGFSRSLSFREGVREAVLSEASAGKPEPA